MRNLRSLKWFATVDPDLFFPRCYDVTQPEELDDFILDYKQTRALSILQSILKKAGITRLKGLRRPATRLGKYSSEESVHREWSTVVIVIVIFIS